MGFPWLEQKVTEWGCMQALIDFEGWRKWRGYEDSPRSIATTMEEEPPSPQIVSRPRNNTVVQAVKVSSTGPKEDSTQISIVEPESSGSGSSSSKDEDIEVPLPQDLAQDLAQETKEIDPPTNGV